jgi:hypothetical protein
MRTKFTKITSTRLKDMDDKPTTFYAYRAIKHHSVCNSTGTASSVAQPGNYVVADSRFNMFVFNRELFKQAFGHEWLQKLDEEIK